MRVRVLVEITADDGAACAAEELVSFEFATGTSTRRARNLWQAVDVVGGEVGFSMVQASPRLSWTRGIRSTPDCARGRKARERGV